MATTEIHGPILVTGATGAQGGGVVMALLRAGRPVRALVRDPGTESAKALAVQGVDLVRGDFTDIATLDAALEGVGGVFSMQMPPRAGDPTSEVRTGLALIDAAYRAGVGMFVHTSVARAGDQDTFAESRRCRIRRRR